MSDTQIAVQERPFVKASTSLSMALGIESGMMIETIKAQCFKSTKPADVTDAQLAAYVSVANALPGINPLLPGMLYAYPEKNGGITPIIGPDGIFSLLASNPDIVAQSNGGPAWYTEHGVEGQDEVTTAYINHRSKGLLRKKIYVKEWVVSTNPNWNTRKKHMAEVRALKQCARQIIHGLPMDEDERKIAEMVNVTNSAQTEPVPERPDPASLKRGKQGASAAKAEPTPAPQAIDVPATPVAEKKAEPVAAPVQEAKPVETPAAPTPTKLEVGDKKVFKGCIIDEARYENFPNKDRSPRHGCIAKVSGGFVGEVYDVAGGELNPDGMPDVKFEWRQKKPVTLEIEARKSASRGVLAIVVSIKVEEAETL